MASAMRRSNDLETAEGLVSTRSVSVKALLATPGLDSRLSQRIAEADPDQSGGLSLEEIIKVFQSEQAADKERRVMRKVVIGTAIAFVLLCAAICGLTYGMLVLAKETRVSSSGVMVAKGSDLPVATAAASFAMNVTRLHKMAASQVCGMPLETLVVGAEDGSYTVHMVREMMVVPNQRAVITTMSGAQFEVSDAGLAALESNNGTSGRRKLQLAYCNRYTGTCWYSGWGGGYGYSCPIGGDGYC